MFHTLNKNLTNYSFELKIDGHDIERVTHFKFLGVIFSEDLSWKTHTDKLCLKITKFCGVLNRLKNFIPVHILRTLYCSMIQSHINYGILVWGFDLNRLQQIQKRAVRIITRSKYNAHTEPIFKALDLLKVHDIFNLYLLKFYYKYCHNQLPLYFQQMQFSPLNQIHNYNTRFNQHIPVNYTRTRIAQKCIRNHISKIVNQTNQSIIDKIRTHSLSGFTTYTKRIYLLNYSAVCTIEDCYICGR